MIMNEQFHATLKLVTGEEVLARVMKTMEEGEVVFLLDEPIVIEENNSVDAEKGLARAASPSASPLAKVR